MRKRLAMLLTLGALAIALPGCDWFQGKEYYLTGGNGLYVNFRESTTRQIETQLVPYCLSQGGGWAGPRNCVRNFLRGIHVPGRWEVPGLGGALTITADSYWQTAVSYRDDLWDHAISPSFQDHHRCPTFRIDLTLDINWETHSCSW